jgi:lysophospholipase L1-like esterase
LKLSTDRVAALLLAIALLISVGLAALTRLPGAAIDTTVGSAHIFFAADRRLVAAPGDCILVRWNVTGIEAIYLNDEGVVGSGEREICVTKGVFPLLHVVFQDGSTRNYTLDVGIVVANLLSWLLAIVALMLFALAAYLTVGRWLGRRFQSATVLLRLLAKAAVFLLLSVIALGLLLEFGLRFYLTHYGTEEERSLYLYTAEEIHANVQGGLIPLPHLGWGNHAGGEHNRLGYRSPEIEIPKPAGVFRIVALGNSNTYGTGMSREDAYPAQLEKMLREDYGYTNVEVLNDGIGGSTSWQTLVDLAFRVLEVEPDMIIVYQGNLDVGASLVDPDCFQGLNAHRGLPPKTGMWQKRPQPISPSALYRFIGFNLGWLASPERTALPIEPMIDCAIQRTLSDEEASQINPPVYFERNLRTIVAIARAYDIEVLLSTVGYFSKADQEFVPPWIQFALDRHNATVQKVAQELAVPFYDLSSNLAYDAAFWQSDGYHYTAVGTREQARQYAAYIDEQGLIPKPANAD